MGCHRISSKLTITNPEKVSPSVHSVFLLSSDNISIIDIYQGYDILGTFKPLRGEQLDDFMLKCPEGEAQSRDLTDLLVWDQYAIAACDNGCVEVYSSDTFECLYGFGMCENSGISKLRRVDNMLVALEKKGILSALHFG
jgi:hypothetical protein